MTLVSSFSASLSSFDRLGITGTVTFTAFSAGLNETDNDTVKSSKLMKDISISSAPYTMDSTVAANLVDFATHVISAV